MSAICTAICSEAFSAFTDTDLVLSIILGLVVSGLYTAFITACLWLTYDEVFTPRPAG